MANEKYISDNITYAEATHNEHGFANIPDEPTLENMKYVAGKVFEPVRAYLGKPINVNSFYRSVLLNRHIGGVYKSQHVSGEAIDMSCAGQNRAIFNYIKSNLSFDQLIWEFGTDQEPNWVHCSCKQTGNRKEILKSIKVAGITKYVPFV